MENDSESFEIMWTKHKIQKQKVWNDGTMIYQRGSKKLIVKDDDGQIIGTLYLPRTSPPLIAAGEIITLDQILVEIITPLAAATLAATTLAATTLVAPLAPVPPTHALPLRCAALKRPTLTKRLEAPPDKRSRLVTKSPPPSAPPQTSCFSLEPHPLLPLDPPQPQPVRSLDQLLSLFHPTDAPQQLPQVTPAWSPLPSDSVVASLHSSAGATVDDDNQPAIPQPVVCAPSHPVVTAAAVGSPALTLLAKTSLPDETIVGTTSFQEGLPPTDAPTPRHPTPGFKPPRLVQLGQLPPRLVTTERQQPQPEQLACAREASLPPARLKPSPVRHSGTGRPPLQQEALNRHIIVFPTAQMTTRFRARQGLEIIPVPMAFASLAQYRQHFTSSLIESINLGLHEVAARFRDAVQQLHGPKARQVSDGFKFFFDKGLLFFPDCVLHKFGRPAGTSARGAEKAAGPRYFLELPARRYPPGTFAKGDLWVLSNDSALDKGLVLFESLWHGPSAERRIQVKTLPFHEINLLRPNTPVFALHLGSTFHQELQILDVLSAIEEQADNPLFPYLLQYPVHPHSLQPVELDSQPTLLPSTHSHHHLPHHHDFNHYRNDQEINNDDKNDDDDDDDDFIDDDDDEQNDDNAAPALLSDVLRLCSPLTSEIDLIFNEIAVQFRLNEDQLAVLQRVRDWVTIDRCQQHGIDPIILVHGVFGSGKSVMLVAIILFLDQVFPNPSFPQLLVSSQCNIAVDRILLELTQYGFTSICRIGIARKIAKPLLRYTLYRDDKEISETVEMLTQSLLHDRLSPEEIVCVQHEIQELKSGISLRRRERLRTARVVACTTYATFNPLLDGAEFPFIFLDEASQMIEPLSLVPILRFKGRRLIAVGDPHQLPPIVPSYPVRTPMETGLLMTLFVRLTKLGRLPIQLRTTYRCHPQIAELSNRLFYSGQLRHGVTAADRSPLFHHLAPLTFVHYSLQGKEEVTASGSLYNLYEQRILINILKSLFQRPVERPDAPDVSPQIGCIVFYAAFAEKLRAEVARILPQQSSQIEISTVDAFQGAEREVIILACGRTQQLGFIDDPRRLNVAISRAKHHLLILGCTQVLNENPLWKEIIQSCQTASSFISSDQFI